jgi:transcriptional regulator with XRE-family HTH domain
MAFNRKNLRQYMKSKGITQDNLARLIGRDIRTIRRWLSPKHRISPKAIDQICRALSIDPETLDPDWVSKNPSSQSVQIGGRVSVAASNYYALLKREYGVTQKDLIELAPIMFSIIAKRALGLSERLSEEAMALEAIKERMGMLYEIDAIGEIAETIESARRAEDNGWLFGDESDDEDYHLGINRIPMPRLFSRELNELSKDMENKDLFRIHASKPTCQGHVLPISLIDELSCGNVDLRDGIAAGAINLATMDDHLWLQDNESERFEWMTNELRAHKELRTIEAVAWRKANPKKAKLADEMSKIIEATKVKVE